MISRQLSLWLASGALVLAGLAVGCGGGSSGTPGPTGTDSTDTTGVLGTDGTDGTSGTDGTAGTESTESTESTEGSLAGEQIDVSNDPIGVGMAHAVTGPVRRPGGIAAVGMTVAACNGNTVRLFGVADMSSGKDVALNGECLAIGAGGDFVIAASADGTWLRIAADGTPGASIQVAGSAHSLAIVGDTVVGAMGTDGLATAGADLASPAMVYGELATDARHVVAVGGAVLVCDGLAGFKHVTLGADGSPNAGGSLPVEENTMALSAVAISDSMVIGGVGGYGLVAIEIASGSLTSAGTLMTQGYPLSLARLGDRILSSEWTHARLYDVSDPKAPALVARQVFGTQRSMGVVATDGAFYTIGLAHVTKVAVNPAVVVPELHLPRTLIQTEIPPEWDNGSAGILIYNTGRAELVLSNLKTSAERLTLLGVEDPVTVPADDVIFIEASIAGNEGGQVSLTFDTNDLDHPTATVTIDVNPDLLQIGDAAPNFIVPTLDGEILELSELKGQVLHLKLFNSQ